MQQVPNLEIKKHLREMIQAYRGMDPQKADKEFNFDPPADMKDDTDMTGSYYALALFMSDPFTTFPTMDMA